MAKHIKIIKKENIVQIFIDGKEMQDVLNYSLCEDSKGASITLSMAVTGDVEAVFE